MLSALSRVPVNRQAPVAQGLAIVAVVLGSFGLLSVMAFAETTETSTSGHLWWEETTTTTIPLSQRIVYLLLGVGLLAAAAGCALAAVQLLTAQGRLKKYPPILTGVEAMPIQRIAEITNQSRSQVVRDIQVLIDSDTITDFYIDHATESVVSKKYVPKVSHKVVVACYGCGGSNELIVGIPRPCTYCGQPLALGTG